MAPDIRASRVLFWLVAFSAAVAVAIYASLGNYQVPRVSEANACAPLPSNIKSIGPGLSVAQVEAASIAEMRASPGNPPEVPFGFNNPEWLALKKLIHPGDTVHEFETAVTGGHLVLRGHCYIGQITSWIR